MTKIPRDAGLAVGDEIKVASRRPVAVSDSIDFSIDFLPPPRYLVEIEWAQKSDNETARLSAFLLSMAAAVS